jgi:hypothetical protein
MGDVSVNKQVRMTLEGLDGNAFGLMGAFQRHARRQGWTKEEIKVVLDECTSGDYDHLLQTLLKYTTEEEEDVNE